MTKETRMTNDDGGAPGFVIPSDLGIRPSSFTRRKLLRLLPLCTLPACEPTPADTRVPFPKVPWRVTSTTHFTTDLVRQIGGQAVQAECIVPPGVNPFEFAPTAVDISRFRRSDLVLLHGLGLETRWPEDFASLAAAKVKVLTVTSKLPESSIIRPSGPAGPAHPCVWMDPALALLMIDFVRDTLSEVMPKLATWFQPRAYRLRLDIEAAYRTAKEKCTALAPRDRCLFSTHDSLAYLARACDLQARSLTGYAGKLPETLPDSIAQWISSNGVRTLFREATTDADSLRSLLRSTGLNAELPVHSLALPSAGRRDYVALKEYDTTTAIGSLTYALDLVTYTLTTDG
jgi:ABC-type Zn uptake system ZnuABC Zn-binding protein ZnuA